jgi:hypothetical protein
VAAAPRALSPLFDGLPLPLKPHPVMVALGKGPTLDDSPRWCRPPSARLTVPLPSAGRVGRQIAPRCPVAPAIRTTLLPNLNL